MTHLSKKIITVISRWLLKETPMNRDYLSHYQTIEKLVKPGDIILIEGNSRASHIIRSLTHSPWSHAALYIGSLNNLRSRITRKIIQSKLKKTPPENLMIESEIGMGTILSSLSKYQTYHVRILRPKGLTQKDAEKVIRYAARRLGTRYNLRHLLDLGRFLLPWPLVPRRWHSLLFEKNPGPSTKDICTSVIAEAFQSINFPILPIVTSSASKGLEISQRNPRLYVPSDFDFSPYFDIIKYPLFPTNEPAYYHHLPWKKKMESN